MQYTIIVKGGVYDSQAHFTAIQFCHSLLHKGHTVRAVFFLQAAVEVANGFIALSADEFSALAHWKRLHSAHDISLYACISAAERKGVVKAEQAQEYGLSGENMDEAISLTGLASMHEACLASDRVMSFQ